MAEQQLRGLRDALVVDGLVDGLDFAVLGTGEPAALSSEIVVLRGDDLGWHVEYRDLGRTRELLCSNDFHAAVGRFTDEAHALAAGRGRGPRAAGPQPTISLEQFRQGQ